MCSTRVTYVIKYEVKYIHFKKYAILSKDSI